MLMVKTDRTSYNLTMREIVLIAHDIRSTHNVGSLLRTAEGLGVDMVWLTGYSPYPEKLKDDRLPHISRKLNAQIHKTALGAENFIRWDCSQEIEPVIKELKDQGYVMVGLEQADGAVPLPDFSPSQKTAVVLGREVEGLDPHIISKCSSLVEIPMLGEKESFNVVQAAAMVLYHCRFFKT
jgi:23S rRNA (guanosine2251-2'-O)-methyltransferase